MRVVTPGAFAVLSATCVPFRYTYILYGGCPPVTATVMLTGEFTSTALGPTAETVGPLSTVRRTPEAAVTPMLSFTTTLTLYLPAVVSVSGNSVALIV